MLGLAEPWLAYQLDLACLVVGRQVEAALMDGKTIYTALGEKAQAQPGRFRQAAPLAVKKVRIPESGIW